MGGGSGVAVATTTAAGSRRWRSLFVLVEAE